LKKGGELNSSSRISTIPYGFSLKQELNQARLEEIRKEFTNSGAFIIGTIGRLTKQKDYPTLLNAFNEVVKVHPNTLLIVIGEGELDEDLKKFARRLGIDQHIKWIGKTEHINEYLSVMNVFVLSSIYEGFGLVLLEAMQMNIPIIASNNSAIPNVLGQEHPGLVTTGNPSEFSKKILECRVPEVRGILIDMQDKRLKLFAPDIMSKRIDEIYEKILFTNSKN
jgi:glycosyltransferase involved in cell wall biosynthesis